MGIYSEIIDRKKKVEARLVARHFKEANLNQSDSPNCTKECLQLMVTMFVSKEWRCNSIDVKAKILQGKANVFARTGKVSNIC